MIMINIKKIKNARKLGAVVLATGITITFCSCNKNSDNSSQSENGGSSSHTESGKTAVSYHNPESIKNRGELIVGVATGSFEFYKDKDGNDAGYAVDLSKEVAKEIGEGVQVKFIEDKPDELLNKIANGEIDLAMASLDDVNTLKTRFTLSKSYWPWSVEAISLYSKNGEESNYTSQENLNGKKIAVVKDSMALNIIGAYAQDTEVVECENIPACIEKVLNGEADLVGAADAEWTGDGADNPDISKCSITIPANPDEIGCFIPVMRNNEDLKNLIDKVVSAKQESGDLENWILNAYMSMMSLNAPDVNSNTVDSEPTNNNSEDNKSQESPEHQ